MSVQQLTGLWSFMHLTFTRLRSGQRLRVKTTSMELSSVPAAQCTKSFLRGCSCWMPGILSFANCCQNAWAFPPLLPFHYLFFSPRVRNRGAFLFLNEMAFLMPYLLGLYWREEHISDILTSVKSLWFKHYEVQLRNKIIHGNHRAARWGSG